MGGPGGESRSSPAADRLIVTVAASACALSVVLYLAVLAGVELLPGPPWSWALHAGMIGGFWLGAQRIAGVRPRGVAGLLRIRRTLPIPFRVGLAAAALNALVATSLALAGGVAPHRAFLAYWVLMYLMIAVIFGFVLPGIRAQSVAAAAHGEERAPCGA